MGTKLRLIGRIHKVCSADAYAPIEFEQGTILKVLLVNPNSYLVTVDDEFNFTVALEDENKVWRKL